MKRLIFFYALVALLVSPAHAEIKVKKVKKSTTTSLMKLDTTNPATFNCGNVTTPVQEAICRGGLIQSNIDLVKDVNELALSIGGSGQALVEKSQANWRQSRNANCEVASYGRQGTMATTSFIFCVIDANKARHIYLQNLMMERRKIR